MSFIKNLFKKDDDNVPKMNLGQDGNNAWYDEKTGKWKFKNDNQTEEEATKFKMPVKKEIPQTNQNNTQNSNINQTSRQIDSNIKETQTKQKEDVNKSIYVKRNIILVFL